jgi:hypothetical protein
MLQSKESANDSHHSRPRLLNRTPRQIQADSRHPDKNKTVTRMTTFLHPPLDFLHVRP